MESPSHHPPNIELDFRCDPDGLEGWVAWPENNGIPLSVEMLDGEFPVQDANSHAAFGGNNASVDHQNVPVGQAGIHHGCATHPDTKRGTRMLNQFSVEIDGSFLIFLSWARKASRDWSSLAQFQWRITNGRQNIES